ncbi:restriction endonuclease [Streptomyces sp. NBC_01142]|nr:restriction endonuclease [Streptomyces sp. NBC_01142]
MRQHGNVGTDSREFEEAVGRAFTFLGFQTEHLGGSGRTDVLAIAQLATKEQYRIIVDAKSSGNGQVAESSVKFDALRDHKRKHKADHVVVVGPEFAPRLKNWAVENEVILLRIEDLTTFLDRHSRNPMPLTELRDAFSRIDTFGDDLDERYQALERRSLLMRRIIDLASQEAVDEDPVDEGYISVENIIYALRKEFAPRPSRHEVDVHSLSPRLSPGWPRNRAAPEDTATAVLRSASLADRSPPGLDAAKFDQAALRHLCAARSTDAPASSSDSEPRGSRPPCR